MNDTNERQGDLLSDITDLDLARHLLADMHDDLYGKVMRLRQLTDLGGDLGRNGTMIFGSVAALAWGEARSSFINGNFVSTVLLCQSMVEHLLASFLQGGLLIDDLPPRISFRETLKHCRDRRLISAEEEIELEKLMKLRNPLSHYRHVGDDSGLDRRSIDGREPLAALIHRDAVFAIGLATRILSKTPFRLG
jgi:hypothetical protein